MDWKSNFDDLLDLSIAELKEIEADGAPVFQAVSKRFSAPATVKYPICVVTPVEDGPDEPENTNTTNCLRYRVCVSVIHKCGDETVAVRFLLWCREQIKAVFRGENGWMTGHQGTEVVHSSIRTEEAAGGGLIHIQRTLVDFLVDEAW